MGRAPCCTKAGLKKGRWTVEEDELLMKYIKVNGEGSWRSLPKNAGLLRCGKSCRLRWINYLRGDLKRGNISAEEEETIIKLHTCLGNRWSLIAAQLPGRTDNEIKNYWNSHLSRRIHSFRRADGDGTAVIMDLGKIVGIPCKRRGGRTSRSATKKNNTVTPIPKCRQAQDGAALPPKQAQSETKGSSSDGGSHPACGVPAGGATGDAQNSSILAHQGSLGSKLLDPEQLLPSEFWETTKEMTSELFSLSDEMGGGLGGAGERSGGWASNEDGDSNGWSTVGPLSEERESGATMSSCSAAEETESGPTIRASREGRDSLGAGDGVDDLSAREHQQAEREECDNAVTMDRWADMELEEMAARLWNEAGEAWSWQHWQETSGSGELHLQQQCMGCGAYEWWGYSQLAPL